MPDAQTARAGRAGRTVRPCGRFTVRDLTPRSCIRSCLQRRAFAVAEHVLAAPAETSRVRLETDRHHRRSVQPPAKPAPARCLESQVPIPEPEIMASLAGKPSCAPAPPNVPALPTGIRRTAGWRIHPERAGHSISRLRHLGVEAHSSQRMSNGAEHTTPAATPPDSFPAHRLAGPRPWTLRPHAHPVTQLQC